MKRGTSLSRTQGLLSAFLAWLHGPQDTATQRRPRTTSENKVDTSSCSAKRSQLNETLDKLSLFFTGAHSKKLIRPNMKGLQVDDAIADLRSRIVADGSKRTDMRDVAASLDLTASTSRCCADAKGGAHSHEETRSFCPPKVDN